MRSRPSTASAARSRSAKSCVAVVIRVHGLAEEHDLAEAPRDRGLAPGAISSRERQAALAAARVGDDAVGAELVAAALRP